MAEETQRATEYAEKWEIQRTFTNALTKLLVAHPPDPMGFLYDQLVTKTAAPTIDKLIGREILDSEGYPTIEVSIYGFVQGRSVVLGAACAPSSDLQSSEDGYVMLDNITAKFNGRGVKQAIAILSSTLQPVLHGMRFADQRDLDTTIISCDGTHNFRKIGINTSIACSAALATASARALKVPVCVHLMRTITPNTTLAMPRPAFAAFHPKGGPIDTIFLLGPSNLPVGDQARIVDEVCLHYEKAMQARTFNDGCFVLDATEPDDILAALEIAVSGGGHTLGDDIFLGLKGSNEATPKFWIDLFEQAPSIAYLVDILPYGDTDGWRDVVAAAPEHMIVAMGDGIASKAERINSTTPSNAVVIKPAQCGTLSKASEAAEKATKLSKRVVISTSNVETHDTWVCDLAVAIGAHILQIGAIARGENAEKVNRLMRIVKEMEVDYADEQE